ncbi:hypothetical protein NSQ95_08840 [Psychrobacillus sp. FSL W7-1457]|uniref:hypothetical protein n=1 Tax=unclassified Psychrobacillus TaxID=2636677 RepID=UPI00260AAAEC|nr:hypothetical protein [uncultured Psychrobacillus sp.]
MIDAFKLLYKNRTTNDITEEEVRNVIKSELLDEYTHPRVRQSIEKKREMITERVKNSKLSISQQEDILLVIHEEYMKLSRALEN